MTNPRVPLRDDYLNDFPVQSKLAVANASFKAGRYADAVRHYELARQGSKPIARQVDFNLDLLEARVGKGRMLEYKGLVPSAGKIYWQKFTTVEEAPSYSPKIRSVITRTEEALASWLGPYPQGSPTGPLASIIMPTYNRAGIIAESIQSVLQQTYGRFELIICDDGSTDDTRKVLSSFPDSRITYLKQANAGAANARNTALSAARGEIVTYLDTDNLWHPRYLEAVVRALVENPGRSSLYTGFVDYEIRQHAPTRIRSVKRPAFNHERLLESPYIDLNTFAHRRELYETFGGFDELLKRRQDYDLILKYTWLRDPLHLDFPLALYQRNEKLGQITQLHRHDARSVELIARKIPSYFADGLPAPNTARKRLKVSVIIWDHCRNHFSKPYAVAEALAARYDVELISFDFFGEGIFQPLRGANPPFETKYFKGSDFPDFFTALAAAAQSVSGDIMYVVKPRVPSFGLAMLVNFMYGTPFILETNDLETVVNSPKLSDRHAGLRFDEVDPSDPELRNPYSVRWTQLLEPLLPQTPVLVTHNKGLDQHYGASALYMRNLKDEEVYSPTLYDRTKIRERLGFAPEDRIILFGGLIRKHKGIYELIDLVERLDDPRYKLVFVGSRKTPDQQRLVYHFGERVKILPPQDRQGMAEINLAADLVILWLNPAVPASHYQFPYKATDAFAMQTPVIANDISDLGDLGRQGYLRLVDFEDWMGMLETIQGIFNDPDKTSQICAAARRLYLRQFSYAAARGNFELARHRAEQHSNKVFSVSRAFTKFFGEFSSNIATGSSRTLPPLELPTLADTAPPTGASVQTDSDIRVLNCDESWVVGALPDNDVLVIVTAEGIDAAANTARLFRARADYPVSVLVLTGHAKEQSLRRILTTSTARYAVITGEQSFPCRDWLRLAYGSLNDPSLEFAVAATGQSYQPLWQNTFAARETLLHLLAGKPSTYQPVHNEHFLIADLEKARSFLPNHDERQSKSIQVVDVAKLSAENLRLDREICVVMPSINERKACRTARYLEATSGIEADYVIAMDSKRQGFIRTLNDVVRVSEARFIVYLAEDAAPGEGWLRRAHEDMLQGGAKVVAFNCGKWHGRVAAFGMVDREWAYSIYGDQILFEGYRSHRADNEISLIARALGQFSYCSSAILLEDDPKKDFKVAENEAANFSEEDKNLFKARYKHGFDGTVPSSQLAPYFDEYFDQRKLRAQKQPLIVR